MAQEIENILLDLLPGLDSDNETRLRLAKEKVIDLCNFIKSERDGSEKDSHIESFFNEESGIHKFLQNVKSNLHVKDSVKQVLILYKKLIEENYPINNYSKRIIDSCKVVKNSMQDSNLQRLALEVITNVLIKSKNVDQEDVVKLVEMVDNMLNWLKMDPCVKKAVFQLIGAIAEHYHEAMLEYQRRHNKVGVMERFMMDVVNDLDKVTKQDRDGKAIMEGCFDALIGLFVHYNYSYDDKKIYMCTKSVISKEIDGRRVHQRRALKFVEIHVKRISSHIRKEYEIWHIELLKWVKSSKDNKEDKVAGYNAYIAVIEEIARMLVNEPDSSLENKKIFKYFMDKFNRFLNTNEAEEKEVSIAITGIGKFCCLFNHFSVSEEVNDLFEIILSRARHDSNCRVEEKVSVHVLEYLETLSKMCCELKENLTHNQLEVVQQLVVMIIELYLEVDVQHKRKAVNSIAINIYYVSTFLTAREFESYLDTVVYHGLIRSYKPNISLESLNDEGTKYFKLWIELFSIQQRILLTPDLSLEVKKGLVDQICDSFINVILRLFNKLDVSIKKKDLKEDEWLSDPELALEPTNSVHYAILCYLSALCVKVLDKISWNYRPLAKFLKYIVLLSSHHNLVPFFYDVMTEILKIAEKKKFFVDENHEDSKESKHIVTSYLEDILVNLHLYPTKIQVPCLKVITSAPVALIYDLLHHLSAAFKVVFRIGYGELILANCGVNALERWIGELTNDQLKPLMNDIIPQLHPYLRSKRLNSPALFGDTDGSLPSKQSQRYRELDYLQSKLDLKDSELLKLQKRILGLLGQLDSPFLLSLLNQDHSDSVISWNSKPVLKLEMKFPNVAKVPIIYLDGLASRAIDLALTSGDRKTRVAAYEVLQAIFVIFLGETASFRNIFKSPCDLQRKLLPGLFKLACSSDSIACQIFSQLLLGSCHWYANEYCHRNKSQWDYVATFVDAIFDALTSSSDHSIRDFGAKCLSEYVSWALDHISENDQNKRPSSIANILEKLNVYCLHPCPFKREGARLGFNAMYTKLRRVKSIVEKYWLEILYYYVKSLSLSTNNKQTLEALDHICRVLAEKSEIFNKLTEKNCRKPPEFNGVLLKDAVYWLLTQCSSVHLLCQQKCMALVTTLAPYIPGYSCIEDYLHQITEQLGADKLALLCEGGGKEKILIENPLAGNSKSALKWLNHVFAAVNCYTWLVQRGIDVNNIIQSPDSKFVGALQYFVKDMSSCSAPKLTTREINQFSAAKCQLSLAIFEFIININVKEVIHLDLDFCWNDYYTIWITRCIMNPPLIGFNEINKIYKNDLKSTLLRLLKIVPNAFLKEKLFPCIVKEFQNKEKEMWLHLHDSFKIKNEKNIVLAALPYLTNHVLQHKTYELYIDVFLFLEESKLKLELWKPEEWSLFIVIDKVFQTLTNEEINSYSGIESYLALILHFAFQLDSNVDVYLTYLFDDDFCKFKKLFEASKKFQLVHDEIINYLLNNNVRLTVKSFTERFTYFISSRNNFCLLGMIDFMNNLLQEAIKLPDEVKENLFLELCSKWIDNFLTHRSVMKKKEDVVITLSKLTALVPKRNIRECDEASAIRDFLFAELKDTNNKEIQYKSLILEMLPVLVKSGRNDFDTDLWDILSNFRFTNFPLNSNEYRPGSKNELDYKDAFEKLLTALKQTADTAILKTVITVAAGDKNHPCTKTILSTLKHFKRFGSEKQLDVLLTTYRIFMNNIKSDKTIKLAVVKDFLLPTLELFEEDVIKKFFEKIIQELFEIILNKKSFQLIEKDEEFCYKAGAYLLLDAAFSYISKEYLTSEHNIIDQILHELEEKYAVNAFYKAIILCAKKVRGNDIPSEGNGQTVNLFYACQGAAYNLLIKILTVIYPEVYRDTNMTKFYKQALFDEEIWEKLVPCDKKYKFEMDFDELLSIKKQFVGVRQGLRKERKANNFNSSASLPVTYSSYSQALFNSSLCEDLSKFDFSRAMVLSDEDVNLNVDDQNVGRGDLTKLESDDLNNHECMPALCYLVHFLSSKSSISSSETLSTTSHYEHSQENKLPFWMQEFHKILEGNGHKKNVRLFILKIIINCQQIFENFAQHFVSPVIQTILDDCAGNSINYVITDAIKMIISWANKAAEPNDIGKISKLLEYIFDNAVVDDSHLFKFMIEILRDIVEAWKLHLQIPYDGILLKLRSNRPNETSAAIEFAAILLSNNVQPFTDTEKRSFYSSLVQLMWKDDNMIGIKSFEVIGLFFKFLTKKNQNSGEETSDEVKFYVEDIAMEINNKKCRKTHDIIIKGLRSMQRHYPLIIERFTKFAIIELGRVQSKICSYVLEIVSTALTLDLEETTKQLLMNKSSLMKILKLSCAENQLLSLDIVYKMLPVLDQEQLQIFFQEVVNLLSNQNSVKYREKVYKIFKWMFENYSISDNLREKVRVKLLKGLQDTDENLRDNIFQFLRSNEHLKTDLHERIIYIFTKLYAVESEQNFMGLAVCLLLDACLDCEDVLFNQPLAECQMEEMEINTSDYNPNLVPLFLQSVSSQMNSLSLGDEIPSTSSFSGIGTMQERSLVFEPTVKEGSNQASFSASSLVSLSSVRSQPSFSSFPKFTQSSSGIGIPSSSDAKGYRIIAPPPAARLLKNKKVIGKSIAQKHRIQNEELENTIAKKKAKIERDVTLTGKYRKGDFPDIEIKFSSVVKKLQLLSEKDSGFASQLMTYLLESIFKSILNETSVNEMDKANKDKLDFIRSLNNAFCNILDRTKTPSVVSTIFEISEKFSNNIEIAPVSITEVSKRSGLNSLGALLLEKKLIHDCDNVEPPPAKKFKATLESSSSSDLWAQLAHIYRNMDEDDIVQGIFEEKLASIEARKALESEAAGHLEKARKQYSTLIKNETSLNEARTDFLFGAYFGCLAKMSDWSELNRAIKSQVDNEFDDLWQQSNKECLLPWSFTSELHCTLEENKIKMQQSEFIDHVLRKWMNDDAEKCDYIKTKFGEELALFYLFIGKIGTARTTSLQNIDQFLKDWAELPSLAHNVMVNKCFQLPPLMDIDMFLRSNLLPGKEVKKSSEWSNNVVSILDKWQSNSPSAFDSVIFWETRTKYRSHFCNLLSKQAKYFNDDTIDDKLATTQEKIWNSLLDCALSQKNFYLAKKLTNKKSCLNVALSKAKSNKENSEGYDFLQLKKSKTILLSAKMYDDNFLKRIQKNVCAWKEIEPFENSSSLSYPLKFSLKCHVTEICKDIFSCLEKYPEKWNELPCSSDSDQEDKLWLLKKVKSLNCDNVEKVMECLYEKGLENLQCATEIAVDIYNSNKKTNLEQQKLATNVAETYLTLTKYCLRKGDVKDQLQQDEILIKSLLRSMNYGSSEARQLFPCLLDVPSLPNEVNELFQNESEKVPEWMFLPWINQLLANLDTNMGPALQPLLLRLAKTYPTALKIPFHISCTKFTYSYHETERFVGKLKEYLSYDSTTEQFLDATLFLRVPLTSLFNYVNEIYKLVIHDCLINLNETILEKLFERDQFKGPLYDNNKPHKKALEEIHKSIKNGCRKETLVKDLEDLLKKIQEDIKKNKRSILKLRDISPWLDKFNRLIGDIEIPGQYTGDSKPLPNLHIMISRLSDTVSVMSSARTPIKIGILGHDGIERGFLVKCGEDLRQDQRIQQLLKLMNEILIKHNMAGRNLVIGTYSVIPLTADAGLISWIDNTQTYRQFMEASLSEEELAVYNRLAIKHEKRIQELVDINSPIKLFASMYTRLSQEQSISIFRESVSALPDNIFSRSVQKLSQSSAAYHYLRSQIGRSLAVMSICHWILGIGDRHLENTLVRMTDGYLYGIDFGHAFGTATQNLYIPELMPFRLTPKILHLFSPFRETGLLKETMVRCLETLQKHERVLKATMKIFIQEPSLNWLEDAKKKTKEFNRYENCEESGNESWLPSQKIEIVERKLRGANPRMIMCDELEAGHKQNKEIFEKMREVLKGRESQSENSSGLTPREQVACLIDQATDEHILSKTYFGWEPWI